MATKQEKIDTLLKEMKDTLETPTKEEFLAFAKQVVGLIQKLRQENKVAADKLQKTFEDETARFIEINSGVKIERMKVQSIKGLEADFGSTTKQLKKSLLEELSILRKEIKDASTKSFKEQSNTMNLLRDKVRGLKDGHTPTDSEIRDLIKPFIPEIEKVEAPNLERLDEEDKRLNDKIEEVEKKIEEMPTRRLGGTGGDANVAYSLNRLVTSETPSGAINGSNTAYTLTRIPKAILSFYINGMFIHPAEYTQVGTTITFSTALPSSLSGKGFTITFV